MRHGGVAAAVQQLDRVGVEEVAARLDSIESLRYSAPGEWGKLLGLDRIPEIRTLRAKIQLLAQEDRPAQWNAALCERWMAAAPEPPVMVAMVFL